MRYIIITFVFALIFSSCKNHTENSLSVFRISDEGLRQSNKMISSSTAQIYARFSERVNDFSTKEMAEKWQPKAKEVVKQSASVVRFIGELKAQLKEEAGGNNFKEKDWDQDYRACNRVFKSQRQADTLFAKLVDFQNSVLAIDKRFSGYVERYLSIISKDIGIQAPGARKYFNTLFSDIPVMAATVLLSKFENSIRVTENELVGFCYNQIGFLDGSSMFEKFSLLVGQSSNYLKAGSELEINAGMGSFSVTMKPKMVFDGKMIEANENGVAVYKFKVPSKAGKYVVPILTSFIAEDGQKQSITSKVEYTVVEEK